MSKAKQTPPASPVADFEKALAELEHTVQAMENGEQSLEQSLAAYERGIALYRQCQAALEQAEQRVTIVNNPAAPELQVPFRQADAD